MGTSYKAVILHIKPIRDFILRLTAKFFAYCPPYPNPQVQQIGNYTLADLINMYRINNYKHRKHILLYYSKYIISNTTIYLLSIMHIATCFDPKESSSGCSVNHNIDI